MQGGKQQWAVISDVASMLPGAGRVGMWDGHGVLGF